MTLLSHRKPMKLTGDAEAVGPLFRAYQLPVLGKNEDTHQRTSVNPPYALQAPKSAPLYLDYTVTKTPVNSPSFEIRAGQITMRHPKINNMPRFT